MTTPTNSPILLQVDIADIERTHQALMGLSDSASAEGCEEPYAVIDVSHLNALKSAFLPMRKMLDDAAAQAREAEKTATAQIPVEEYPAKAVTVVVEAFETSAWGADGPEFMSLSVTRDFLAKLQAEVDMMVSRGIASITLGRYPEDWGPGNIHDELRLQDSEMVVTSMGAVWFQDRPQHADYEIQSRSVSLQVLREAFDASEHLGTHFIARDDGVIEGASSEFVARYWEDEREKALSAIPPEQRSGDEPAETIDPASPTPEWARYNRAVAAWKVIQPDEDGGDDEDVGPAAPAQ
ncbi:MAG: hypothetical protein K2W33_15010 [Burkholderiales bacterium]|nr:hypothetical protein [Burkholderiales bacterium]